MGLLRTVLEAPPAGFSAQAVSSSQINLSWTANSRATSYSVYRNGVLLLNQAGTSLSVTGLAAATSYGFTVSSLNGTAEGPQSSTVNISTLAAPDTTAPSVPGSLAVAALSSSSLRITWGASTDTGGSGLSGYRLERSANGSTGWTQIAQQTGLSYDDTGLSASTQYYYRVRAYDGAANNSGYSAITNGTTQAASGGGVIETSSQSFITQYGITVTFDSSYPVGQFVNGDYFVLPNGTTYPIVTAVSPAWDGTLNGATVNPAFAGPHGWRSGGSAPYNAAQNVAASLPYQLVANDALMPSIGIAGTNPRPGVSRIIVITCLASAPAVGSFRPPYLAGSDKTPKNISAINWSALPNVATVASAPSWTTVSAIVNNGPWINLINSNTQSRYIQPSGQMDEYGRDLAADIMQVVMKLCTSDTQANKEASLYGLLQVAIDTQAIVRYGYENNVEFGSDGLGMWGMWAGGLGLGRKEAVYVAAKLCGWTEFIEACRDFGPRWWHPDGSTLLVADAISAGATSNAANWLERYYGYSDSVVTVAERPIGRPTNTTQGIPGYTFGAGVNDTPPTPDASYDAGYHNMQGASSKQIALMCQLFSDNALWGWEPTLRYAEMYANGPEGGTTVATNGPNFTQFQSDMWETHYADQFS